MESLTVHAYSGIGYQPLVYSADWQVAILNWEPPIDPSTISEIERHVNTDEVFVLWRGRCMLFLLERGHLRFEEMSPGLVYNVARGTWHNLIASRDASMVIIENRGTHINDTELRKLTAREKDQLRAKVSDWDSPTKEKKSTL